MSDNDSGETVVGRVEPLRHKGTPRIDGERRSESTEYDRSSVPVIFVPFEDLAPTLAVLGRRPHQLPEFYRSGDSKPSSAIGDVVLTEPKAVETARRILRAVGKPLSNVLRFSDVERAVEIGAIS